MRRPTLFLTVGLPGTGKTTDARRIEVEKKGFVSRSPRRSPDAATWADSHLSAASTTRTPTRQSVCETVCAKCCTDIGAPRPTPSGGGAP